MLRVKKTCKSNADEGSSVLRSTDNMRHSKAAGVTPEGDRLFFVRKVSGKSHDQLAAMSNGLIDRSNWIAIEKGRIGVSGLKSISGIAAALGVSVDDLRAYLSGSYGAPSAEAAQRFLAARKNVEFDRRVDDSVLELAYAQPAKAAAYVLAALNLKRDPPAFLGLEGRPISVEEVKRLIRVSVGEIRPSDE